MKMEYFSCNVSSSFVHKIQINLLLFLLERFSLTQILHELTSRKRSGG